MRKFGELIAVREKRVREKLGREKEQISHDPGAFAAGIIEDIAQRMPRLHQGAAAQRGNKTMREHLLEMKSILEKSKSQFATKRAAAIAAKLERLETGEKKGKNARR